MATELGMPSIKPHLSILRESQRIQLAKRLNESGIADEAISANEAQKKEMMKYYAAMNSPSATKQEVPQQI